MASHWCEDLIVAPEHGVVARRVVGERQIDLVKLTYGRWALKCGTLAHGLVWSYDCEYTYEHPDGTTQAQKAAINQMCDWDGASEPDGWIRAVVSGRTTRRRPDGDRAREYERA